MNTTAAPAQHAQPPDPSDRFQRKRDRILDAAAQIINERGLKGLTFVAVAEAVELNTTSVTYYFKRKEMLAAAAIERTIDLTANLLDAAADGATADIRVRNFTRLYLEQAGKARLGRERPTALLSDLRALEEPERTRLSETYVKRVLHKAKRFFDPDGSSQDSGLNHVRAFILLESLFWSRAWLVKYSVGDYERVSERVLDLFNHGLFPDGTDWHIGPIDDHMPQADNPDITPETYLRAATRLINERGYRGASVERIAGELNVSKGSFYHHLEGKDNLVLECFHRSYGRISQAQRAAINLPGTYRDRLATCMSDLLDIQFDAEFPMVRITALQALPTDLRRIVLDRSDRTATRFAGMISDGIIEGSIRRSDPLIASQWVTGLMNSACDLRPWADDHNGRSETAALYIHTIAKGLFAPI
ncbi:MAG: TetR/AcrR family transcriptional regulator [Pseudooceanicola sp.]